MIPYSRQNIQKKDIKEVSKILKSDFITQGPIVKKLENKLSKFCGAKFASALNSATSALHISCLALGLKKNDILWTTPNSFVASANCGLYCGAKVSFVDIDPNTYCMSLDDLEKKLILAKKKNKLPKIIVPVHYAGYPMNIKRIYQLKKKYNFYIIEDASHALGAQNNDFKVGSCKYSDITVLSLHAIKIITAAEGGIILNNSKQINEKVNMLKEHGITRNIKKIKNNDPWIYEQRLLGYNYRMSELHGGLALSQMRSINKNLLARKKIAERYFKEINKEAIRLPFHFKGKKHKCSYHLFPLLFISKNIISNKRKIFKYLLKKKIKTNVHYIPIHLQPYFRKMGFKKGDYPKSEKFYLHALSIPMYYGLSKKQQSLVINSINGISKKLKV